MFRSLIRRFVETAEHFPERPALVVDKGRLTYAQLLHSACTIARTIQHYQAQDTPLIAVFGSRTETVYKALLAAQASGKGYVPLNPKFPPDRTREMLRLSEATVLVVDSRGVAKLADVLPGLERAITIILPDETNVSTLAQLFPVHTFVPGGAMKEGKDEVLEPAPDSTAYLLFTSGSTGLPKGVAIRQSNVAPYIDYVAERYDVTETDRLSQEFDLTFDLSVHDMFVCWERGACLYVVPEKQVGLPAKFIRDQALTMWFSVPSVIGTLSRLRLLQPGCFSSLRWSLFCGEPLSASYASTWQQAASGSIVENLYGPTEATIAISHYRWNSSLSPAECRNGIVPIGSIFTGQHYRVVDERGGLVSVGEVGQLCLGGSQVANGYWNDEEKSSQCFAPIPEAKAPMSWYFTGDMVRQDEDNCLHYLGRIDQQVKIRGYRVELQEVELILRRVCRTEWAVAIPWPVNNGLAEGIVAFVCCEGGKVSSGSSDIIQACRQFLPDYMVPKTVRFVSEIPLNQNGKIDRKKLSSELAVIQ